mgnify:CR=1 FL=1
MGKDTFIKSITKYIAHNSEDQLKEQTIKEHSRSTAELCREFSIPELKDVMYVLGMLHDVGKYQESYQRRIRGENIKVEHSGCGALAAKKMYPNAVGLLMEYCISGHHSGIPDGGFPNDTADLPTLYGRLKRQFENFSIYEAELEFPPVKIDKLISLLASDCGKSMELLIDQFSFWTRYCFSCLTDADSIDTANFCNGEVTRPLRADFHACLEKIDKKLSSFDCATQLQKARGELQKQVFKKKDVDAKIFLMNMPTGSGKTLCSAKFALERAINTRKKRIIYIIPYNSIIDQTVRVFEELFGEDAEILRHQSTFSYEDNGDAGKSNKEEDYARIAKSATENWNVTSFIVTTAVQFFESIYANKRGKLRKLHNMADSVLIFDEAHMMPVSYLQPCLRGIGYITRYLNSEAIFLTATMPDFPKLIRQYVPGSTTIVDLIEDSSLFSTFQKCQYQYIGEQTEEELLAKAMDSPSCLFIVNTRQAARRLYRKCGGKKYHLSTYMTAYDRKRVLKEIGEALESLETDFPGLQNVSENRRITIISTSLIEAGVDLDAFTVFRELSGLDSVLQAGGRCNREGKRTRANVYIFEISGEKRNSQDVRSNITKGIIERYKDISCQQSIREYYERLLFMRQGEIQRYTISQECSNIFSIPFRKYAEEFELINSKIVSIVVPRDKESQEMAESLRFAGASVNLGRKLQKYTCSVYQKELDDLISQHVVDSFGTGISCLTNMDYYDDEIGILFDAKDYFI